MENVLIQPARLAMLKKLVRDILFEDWMSEDDWLELEDIAIDYHALSSQIDIGISNGYSENTQIEIAKQMIAKL